MTGVPRSSIMDKAEMATEIRFKINKDPVAWATHFGGLIGSIVGLVLLVIYSAHDAAKVASMAIYGSSLVVLFGASATYHFLDLGERGNRWLRQVDHAAIFFLIAGSYVPPSMHLLDGAWRISILSVVAAMGIAGIVFKIVWIDCPAPLSTALYLAMGWLAVVPAFQMFPQLDIYAISFLVFGGLAYTVGAVVFVRERPDPWPDVFGHHEVWHVLVLLGATGHFFFTWQLMEKAVPGF